MALNLEDILAEYADPERKRKAENATRDRSLLAGLSDAYAQSQQPYGAKYNALSGQNGLIAAQAPIKSFEREQDVLSNLAGNARMQDQAEAQAAAQAMARDDRLAAQAQDQSQFEALLGEREAERMRRAKAQEDHLAYLQQKSARRGAGRGQAAPAKGVAKTEGLQGLVSQVDSMDLTPAQRALVKNAQATGDLTTLRAIVQDEAKLQADRSDKSQGKAQVADFDNLMAMADKILKQYDPKTGKFPEGIGGDLATRMRYLDVPDYPMVGALAKGASNIVSSRLAQENRQLMKNLSDEVRKEKYGSSFTGGEKGEFGELSGQEATSDPIARINFLKQIRERSMRQKSALSAPRRNAGAALAADSTKPVRFRTAEGVHTGTLQDLREAQDELGADNVQVLP